VRLPISFKSFGDYKAPLAIYINGLFTYFIGDQLGVGMQLWLIRLPFALSGVAAVGGMWLLLRELWPVELKGKHRLSWQSAVLVGTTVFLTTPWFLHFARTGFESGMSLAFMLWGSWGLVKILSPKTSSLSVQHTFWMRAALVVVTVVGLVAAMYTYHSAKIVVPLLSLLILALFNRQARSRWRWIVTIAVVSLMALYPLISDTLYGHGAERFEQSTVFSSESDLVTKGNVLVKHFAHHLSLPFLMLGETPTLRHGDGRWGVLLPTTLALVLIGVSALLVSRRLLSSLSVNRLAMLGLGWWIVGLVPAAIGVDVPHSNRALLALPGAVLLAVVGYAVARQVISASTLNRRVVGSHGEQNTVWQAVVGSFWLFHAVFFCAYLNYYYTEFARRSADDFRDGYLEALSFVVPYEKGTDGFSKVNQVVFTTKHGQPYIYTLLARHTDPIWYQGGALNTYLFTDVISASDLERPNTIVVASGSDDVPVEKADKVVYGSDGEVTFKIYVNQE
jgi:hypothetical protein